MKKCTMKKIFVPAMMALMLIPSSSFGQARGNYDIRDLSNFNFQHPGAAAVNRQLAQLRAVNDNEIRLRGLSNCTADSYLAIFTVSQVGKTQQETDELLRNRISAVREALAAAGGNAELFIDMISFLPIYELEESRKLFSKTTYNEIPRGFELKKNLHFRYTDPRVLEQLVTLCAAQEIYDIVRVDYFINDIEKKKDELMKKAGQLLERELTRRAGFLNIDFSKMQRQFADAFAMYYPIEQYRSYQTYHSNTLSKGFGGETKSSQQSTAQFFLPRMSKDYDFVINNTMLEPVIQIEYELVLRLTPMPEPPKPPKEVEVVKTQKEVFLITPQAEIKKLTGLSE